MNKLWLLFLLACLTGGCIFHKNTSNTSFSTEPLIIEEETAEDSPVSAEIQQTADAAAEKTVPVAKQTTSPVAAPISTLKEEKQEEKSMAKTKTAPTVKNSTPVVPTKVTPAPDKPVFKGEELISTADRRMHPYAALQTDPDALQQAPWAYEQLKFGIYYSLIKAGTAYIRNRGLVDINGRKAYLIQTSAFSASVIDTVFKVRDINQSWLDAQDLYSLGYSQSVREGNYKRDEWVRFDYANKKYEGEVQKKADPRTIAGPLEVHVLDILSSLYYVRMHPLVVGQDVILDVVNREKTFPLVVKVLKKDTVKTPAGKFKCVVVEPQLRGEGIFVSKGKSLKVWVTDDEYKMPVKMQVEVFIGSVSAELLEYKRQAPENNL